MGTVTTTATAWGWHDVDISGLEITVTSGDFYIAYKQLTDYPNCECYEIPKSGSVPPGGYDEITVTIDTTGLLEGDYSANIVKMETRKQTL